MTFVACDSFSEDQQPDCFVIVNQTHILTCAQTLWEPIARAHLPDCVTDSAIMDRSPLGFFKGQACEALYLDLPLDSSPDTGFEWQGLRSLLGTVSDELFQLAGRAVQLGRWREEHQYCGRCGAKTRRASSDRALVCSHCQLRFYPKISPCVMVLVTRGDECLLARGVGRPEGRYSALAGFIEAGETTEQAAAREVMEEVGIRLGNLQYFGSQPWPFPGQLMLAYTAEYQSGEIHIDDVEIAEAHWFRFDELPLIPPESTISGQLIAHFVASRVRHT